MAETTKTTSPGQLQYRVLAALCVVAMAWAGVLVGVDGRLLRPYTGGLDPLAAALLVNVLGVASLFVLLSRGGFVFYQKSNRNGLWLACRVGVAFGLIIIPADCIIVFPADINVAFPKSLLFYPVIGWFAEFIFHALPLALLLLVITAILKIANRNKVVWCGIILVALLEPAFQTVWMASLHRYSVWAVAFDAAHVFAINLAELALWRRYDFVSMYALRLTYYLVWHVGWGYWRLSILF